MKMNSSHRHDINRPRPRHGYEYTKHKMCPSMMMVLCGKQHLSNIWSWIHEKSEHLIFRAKKNAAIVPEKKSLFGLKNWSVYRYPQTVDIYPVGLTLMTSVLLRAFYLQISSL